MNWNLLMAQISIRFCRNFNIKSNLNKEIEVIESLPVVSIQSITSDSFFICAQYFQKWPVCNSRSVSELHIILFYFFERGPFIKIKWQFFPIFEVILVYQNFLTTLFWILRHFLGCDALGHPWNISANLVI